MAQRFKNIDRNIPLLLPADLRDWVAEDDLVHFVIAAVERVPLAKFQVNERGCGDEQYPPHVLLRCSSTAMPTASSVPGASSERPIATSRCVTSARTRIPTTTPSVRVGAATSRPSQPLSWTCWNWRTR